MLGDLDQIDWKSLTHVYSYSSQEEIPNQIKNLLLNSSDKRERALDFLFGGGQDSGNVYESTVLIIRFVLEILKNPDSPDKELILWRLISILQLVHFEKPKKTSIHRLKLLVAAIEAIEQDINLYIALLSNKNAPVRSAAVILGYMTDTPERVAPVLMQHFETEESIEVRINIMRSVSTLWQHAYFVFRNYNNRQWFEAFFLKVVEDTSLNFPIRVAAGISWTEFTSLHFSGSEMIPAVDNILIQEFLECGNYWRKLEIAQCFGKQTFMKLLNNPQIDSEDTHLVVRGLLARGDIHKLYETPKFETEHLGKFYRHDNFLIQYWKSELEAIVNAEKFWQIPTDLLSTLYDLPDSRQELQALINQQAET
jgi:hypothetical protein